MTQASPLTIDVLAVSQLDFAYRLTANSLQGLANRSGPRLFLDYGVYDDPGSRRTNSVQMSEENWFGKYREYLRSNDQDNLYAYQQQIPMQVETLPDLETALERYQAWYKGLVVWDPVLIDTVNLALMLAALDDLLLVSPEQLRWAESLGPVRHDLRGRFKDRVSLYAWAFENLFPRMKPGQVASFEPEWQRSEFTDYIVQNRLFVYSLSSYQKGGLRTAGQQLFLFLIGGPIQLRNLIFDLRLARPLKWLALRLLESGAAEVRLGNRIQRAVEARPFPTIFGWHCQRDDELSFMLQVSANGLRLAPAFLAGNYSFHSQLPGPAAFRQRHVAEGDVRLEEDKVYLTFTSSDGDQLTLMNTAEVGNFRRSGRGQIPFNHEMQPLLAELAPALLNLLHQQLTPNDYLIAGPSGAGYIIPPLAGNLAAYLKESARLCDLADVRVVTSYISDPPARVVAAHGQAPGNYLGFLAGYFHLGRTPMVLTHGKPFIANCWPRPEQIGWNSVKTLEGIRALIEAPGPLPRFIGCHLLAYNTTIDDVCAFVQTLDPQRVKVVRADEFLIAASQAMRKASA